MSESTFALGPLTVSFSDDEFCCNLLEKMYGDLPQSSSNADIRITGYDWRETGIPPTCRVRGSDRISVDANRHHVDKIYSHSPPQKWVVDRIGQRGYALVIDGLDSEILSLDVYYDGKLYKDTMKPLRYYLKFKDWTFADYRDKVAKNLVYDVFEPIWQARMLKTGASFLHAGSVSVNGHGVALTGWGGAGKTSATSTLIRQSDEINFLSDDLAIITSQGELYPYYKSSVIYPYNTEGQIISESEFLSGFSDRLQWKIHKWRGGKKGVRRRIPPKTLFGEQLGSPSPVELDKVVYLSREKRDTLDHESVTSEELARRSTAVILDELDWLIEYSSTVRAAGSMSIDPCEIIQKTKSIYQESFDEAETVLLRIPMNTPPGELADYLRGFIIRG